MTTESITLYEKKLKYIPYLIIIAFVISFCIVWLVHFNFNFFPLIDVSEMSTNTSDVLYYIDNIKNDNGYLSVNGWCVKKDETLQIVNCVVALNSFATGETRCMKTAMQLRNDLPNALQIEGVEKAGFQAYVDIDNLSVDELYEILLIYRNNNNNILVDTNIKINYLGEIINE